ncbi:uncharacterized protein LOC133297114 [Gastrolobium bilobum]|uniref:uncharacterized protein LOC133297114 n=1 Tax=Gastrolobium bilobum TaxID=150636 RepID=UPI002AAFBDDD|nr:uncharacterized protein LOC133297114 [Gastrolobium bilobum]
MTDLKITHRFASVEHPQTNGQAESANKVIINELKKRLFDAKGNWVQQLHLVLWGYRTSTQSATEETPFKLTYGCEAMIPVEIDEPSWRRVQRLQGTEGQNSEALTVELDLLDECRENARYKNMMAKRLVTARFNKMVRPRSFQSNDLVLRRADIGNKNARDGKLAEN